MCSSGLVHWIKNLELPGSNPPPYLDLFSVVQSSTLQLHFFTACCELLSFLPVGILNNYVL